MSRLCVDEKKSPEAKEEQLWAITDEEIQKVIQESTAKTENKKPSTSDLYERIDELEFELQCLRTDSKEQNRRKAALLRLLEVVDVGRIEERNQAYVRAIVKRIKQLVS